MFYIRADGNSKIGIGHIMRCLSIAEAIKDRVNQSASNAPDDVCRVLQDRGDQSASNAPDDGCRVLQDCVNQSASNAPDDGNNAPDNDCIQECISQPVFITADDNCRTLIEERGFSVIALDTDYQDMMSELPKLKAIFERKRGILLVDSYQADAEYFEAVSKLAYTACFEDMGVPYPVDLLINYNIYAPKLKDKYKLGGESLNTLLGAEYVPLRKAFWESSAYCVRDKVTDVMITTGGSDPYFAAAAFADAFMEAVSNTCSNICCNICCNTCCGLCGDTCKEQITWHIVSGPFNAYADKLKEKYEGFKNVLIHEGLRDLRPLIEKCDVILSASGSTVYEVSAIGVPMIVFYFAENQRQGAQELAALTEIVNAGDFSKDGEVVAQKAAEALTRCITDKNYRKRLYNQERNLIDGKGAYRIAKVLEDLWNMEQRERDN